MVRMQASPYPMVAIEEAIAIVLAHTPVLETEEIPIGDAVGRVLAERIISADDMPPFDTTSVDGYAIISGEGIAPRRVLSEVTAGQAGGQAVTPGTAIRIMTGAPLPPGADAVVMVEQTSEVDGILHLTEAPPAGANIYRRGQDIARGQEILGPGTVLGAAEIGLLATVGRARVRVYRRPVVAVLSTGDELVEADEPLRPGQIRDSNRPALLASVREAGAIPISLGRVRDDAAEQEAVIRQGLQRADVVLTSGGVSVGSRDLIKPILARLGTIHFGRVAFKPGKPTTFATVGDKLVFGLPGFPVSSLVSFEVFVRPALRKMQGHTDLHRPVLPVRLDRPVVPSVDRPEYQRAVVYWSGEHLLAYPTGAQRSSRLLSLVGANALLRIPPGTMELPAGTVVEAILLGDIRTAAADGAARQ